MTGDAPAAPATFGDLGPHEVRVLGCLVEKEATTPTSYPLTRNALRSACNQSTSRDPVLDLTDQEVEAALLGLRDRRLARPVRNPGDRVTKFRHAMPEAWELDGGETAVLAVLLLRGPQTMGELRSRTARLHDFPDVAGVGEVLAALGSREPAMVTELARVPGQKETRWLHLAGSHGAGPVVGGATGGGVVGATVLAGPGSAATGPSGDATLAATFLATAHAVVEAMADPLVEAAWDRPSALEDQAVSSLVGHLARGGVWLVGDYLDAAPPDAASDEPDVADAAAYLADLVDALGEDDHAAIRDRGAAVATVGHDHLLRTARRRLEELDDRLPGEDPDRLVAVFGGLTMRLDDYLGTRIVEQVVHLDDLVRSIPGLAVEVPPTAVEVAERIGLDALRHRHGPGTPVRVLYRRDFADLVPVF